MRWPAGCDEWMHTLSQRTIIHSLIRAYTFGGTGISVPGASPPLCPTKESYTAGEGGQSGYVPPRAELWLGRWWWRTAPVEHISNCLHDVISGAPKKASLPLSLNTPCPLANAWNSTVCRALFLWFKALIPVKILVPLGGQLHYILSTMDPGSDLLLCKLVLREGSKGQETMEFLREGAVWREGCITWGGRWTKGNGVQAKPCVCVWPCAWLCRSPSCSGSCWTPFLNPLPETLIYAAFGVMEPDSLPFPSRPPALAR